MNPPILRQIVAVSLVALVAITAPAAAQPETWALAGGSTTLYFNRHVLSDLGIEIIGSLERGPGLFDSLYLEVSPQSRLLQLEMPKGSFERLVSGALRHRGGFDLRWEGGYVPMQEIELYPSPDLYTFGLRGSDGSAMFVLDYPHARYLPASRHVVFQSMDLRIADELALRLGRPELAGVTIGEGRVTTRLIESSPAPEGIECVANFDGEVDVQLTGLANLSEVFHDSDRVAMAPSAELASVGTADIEWFQSIAPDSYFGYSAIGQHPYLVMHLYRLADGVFQQVGRSDLKHAFFAQNGGCPCDGDQVLYVGCSDLYGSSTNWWFSRLAPRSELTASTGDWVSLGSHFDGEPVDDHRDHNDNDHTDPFEHRLTATTEDLLVPGASYFIEAWYLAKGDIDIFNSMGYRSVSPQFDGGWAFPMTDAGLNQGPAVDAWIDPAAVPPGSSTTTVDTGEGHFKLAVQTTALADGFYHYELALMNLDFDRQIRSLSVALPNGAVVRQTGFDDVDDVVGNDWQVTVDSDAATWATDNGDPAVNALDWGTLYNFRFDTNVAPVDGQLTLGVLEPGDPTNLQVAAKAPGTSALAVHQISLSKMGAGTVLSDPLGIDCGIDCQGDFVEGIDLRLTATPDAGSQLTHWQEGGVPLTESSLLAFEVAGERDLTAVFDSCPAERALSPANVGGEALFETCQTLVAGAGFQVSGPGGDVTFRAGERIALGDGFFVESGARFLAVVDPKLRAATNR